MPRPSRTRNYLFLASVIHKKNIFPYTTICSDFVFALHRIMPKLPSFAKASLAGRQAVAKFRGDGPLEAVRVYLVNVR